MKTLFIRWIGALAGFKYEYDEYQDCFVKTGRLHSLKSSFAKELTRCDEAACEAIKKNNGKLETKLGRAAKIGLVIKKENVFREFHSDVWSYYGQTSDVYSRQYKTQHPGRLYFGHETSDREKECWAHMKNAVEAIVVYGRLSALSTDYRQSAIAASRKYNLPIWQLADGRLIK